MKQAGKLGDGGGLTRSVNTGNENHGWTGSGYPQRAVIVTQHLTQLFPHHRLQVFACFTVAEITLYLIHELSGRARAEVGSQQAAFQFLDEILVDASFTREQAGDSGKEIAGAGEARF